MIICQLSSLFQLTKQVACYKQEVYGKHHKLKCFIRIEISWQLAYNMSHLEYTYLDHHRHDDIDFYKSSQRMCSLLNILPWTSRFQIFQFQIIEPYIKLKNFISFGPTVTRKPSSFPFRFQIFSPHFKLPTAGSTTDNFCW